RDTGLANIQVSTCRADREITNVRDEACSVSMTARRSRDRDTVGSRSGRRWTARTNNRTSTGYHQARRAVGSENDRWPDGYRKGNGASKASSWSDGYRRASSRTRVQASGRRRSNTEVAAEEHSVREDGGCRAGRGYREKGQGESPGWRRRAYTKASAR